MPRPTPFAGVLPPPPQTQLSQPTAQSTATVRARVRLAVPDHWAAVLGSEFANQELDDGSWFWEIVTADEPAEIRLISGDEGLVITQRPLIIAVPFTSGWEETTLAEAEAILKNGHALAKVLEWSELRPQLKALRVDKLLPYNPDYPLRQTWSLVAAPGYDAAAMAIAPSIRRALISEPLVQLSAVGDIMLDRALGYAIGRGDLYFPFANVADVLSRADITLGNLESALGDSGQPAGKRYTFRAPPDAARSLALAGFDVLSLANNHALDYGSEALMQAIDLLDRQGIVAVGAGVNDEAAHRPFIGSVNGLTVAFLGYVDVPVEVSGFDARSWQATDLQPGLAWAEPQRINQDVRAATQQADLVVVVLHSGYEYVVAPSSPQVAAAHAAIDAGAALVVGHHSHVLQGIEFYKEGTIVYGLGNFAFEIDGDPETAILNVWLDRDGVRQLEIIPAIIQFGGQPRLAEPWEATTIRKQVYALTDQLNLGVR